VTFSGRVSRAFL